jgi:hypothetical protein
MLMIFLLILLIFKLIFKLVRWILSSFDSYCRQYDVLLKIAGFVFVIYGYFSKVSPVSDIIIGIIDQIVKLAELNLPSYNNFTINLSQKFYQKILYRVKMFLTLLLPKIF